jgi:hypothetical protein
MIPPRTSLQWRESIVLRLWRFPSQPDLQSCDTRPAITVARDLVNCDARSAVTLARRRRECEKHPGSQPVAAVYARVWMKQEAACLTSNFRLLDRERIDPDEGGAL